MFNLKTVLAVAVFTGLATAAIPRRDEKPIQGHFTIGLYNPITGKTQGTDLLPVDLGIKTLGAAAATNGTGSPSPSPEMYWDGYGGICSEHEGCSTYFSPDTPGANNLEFSLSVGPGDGGLKQVTTTTTSAARTDRRKNKRSTTAPSMFVVPSDGGSAEDVTVWQVCPSRKGKVFYAGSDGPLLDETCQRVALQIIEV